MPQYLGTSLALFALYLGMLRYTLGHLCKMSEYLQLLSNIIS